LTHGQKEAAQARAIIDGNRYMTLGTADATGQPWVSPVWFATADYREFVWGSKPGARHSRNIAERGEVAIVIFDSQVAPGSAQAVYLSAQASEVTDADLDSGLETFSERSRAQGLAIWTRDDVTGAARHRLYRATASEVYVLTPKDERLPVQL
jgi:pyridoxine/pyridoxamine 5'-phosphate oxidase